MQTVIIDLSRNNAIPTVHAMQGDTNRQIKVILYDNGAVYDASSDAVSVWYTGPSGEGNFSNGITKSSNSLTITLNGNMLSMPGRHMMAVVLNRTNGKISTWKMGVIVGELPGYDSETVGQAYDAFQVGQLAARLENLIQSGTPEDGSTELVDIRVGFDKTQYKTAGDAVRGQVGALDSRVTSLENGKIDAAFEHGSSVTTHVYRGLINKDTGEIDFTDTDANYGYTYRNVNFGDAYFVTGSSFSIPYPLVVFKDASGKVVGTYPEGETGTKYESLLIIINNQDYKTMYVNGYALDTYRVDIANAKPIDISKLNTKVNELEESRDEVEDIRTGYDGTSYPTAGDAVRGQISDAKKYIENIKSSSVDPTMKSVFGERELLDATPINTDFSGWVNSSGELQSKNFHKLYSLVEEDSVISVYDYAGGAIPLCVFFSSENSVVGTENGAWTKDYKSVTVPSGAVKVAVNASESADNVKCKTMLFNTDFSIKKKIESIQQEVDGLSSDELQEQVDQNSSNIEAINQSIFRTEENVLVSYSSGNGFYNSSGTLDGASGYENFSFSIKNITDLKIYNFAGGMVPIAVFFEADGNFISSLIPNTAFDGTLKEVSIPSGAEKLIVNCSKSMSSNSNYGKVLGSSLDTSYNVRDHIENLEAGQGDQSAFLGNIEAINQSIFEKTYQPLTPISGPFVGFCKADGTTDSSTNWNYQIFDVKGYSNLQAFNNVGSIVPLLVFFDDSGSTISSYTPDSGWTHKYILVNVPENAATAYFNDNTVNVVENQGTLLAKQYDTSYNVRDHINQLEQSQGTSETYDFEIAQLNRRVTRDEKRNDFVYSPFDKAYFVLTIDDANQYLPGVYDTCHSLGIPVCPSIITSNLDKDWNSDGRTIKDICDLIVADGGEILAHYGTAITNNSTQSDYEHAFRDTKMTLESLGYDVRGIITTGGEGYLSNDVRLDNWSRKYYDYSDQNGLSSSKQYWKPRWWFHDLSMEEAKQYVDNAITNKQFVVMAMHGTSESSDLEYINNLQELLQYMLSKGKESLEITTWAYVYDTFGSTELEERIKSLESK